MSADRLTPGIERRLFVVGVPRSGTTLVQSLLAAHGAATSFTESHFFDRHFRLLRPSSIAVLTRDPGPRLRRFLEENGEEAPDAAAALAIRRRRALLPLRGRATARALLRVLDELALRRGRAAWIEKTPRHLRYLPFLERLVGGAAGLGFVHVIRRGVAVVASLRRASRGWERPYDLAECVRRWNADVAFSLRRLGAPGDHFVFYEELTERPEATLRRLVSDLGLDWRPEMLAGYAGASERLVTPEEAAWKRDVGRDIRASDAAAGTLSEEERRLARRHLRQDLYDRLRQGVGRPATGEGG